jgi:hypothetical protein
VRTNRAEVFNPDSEVLTYASTTECIEKVRWLVDQPAGEREIARCGQKRGCRDPSFVQWTIQPEDLLLRYVHFCEKRSA